jgi:hypothetical protein
MVGPEINRDSGISRRGSVGKAEDLQSVHRRSDFLQAARECDDRKLQLLLDQDTRTDYRDPWDNATALHYIAAYRARPALRVLLKCGKCDFLIRDGQGRLPSQLAREFGRDDAMARLLIIKEMRQAKAQGVDPASLYKVSARKPAL